MKKNVVAMKKSAPRFVDDTHVLVTKEFAKNAKIFGTAEYKLWKDIRRDCEEAVMVTKSIKKKTSSSRPLAAASPSHKKSPLRDDRPK